MITVLSKQIGIMVLYPQHTKERGKDIAVSLKDLPIRCAQKVLNLNFLFKHLRLAV